MELADFMKLTPEEQVAYLTDNDNLSRQIDDLTAERNSLQEENTKLSEQIRNQTDEMRKTKEMNFTLSRRLNLDNKPKKETEDILHDMFSKGGK